MNRIKRLSDLDVGDVGVVKSLPVEKTIRNKLMNIGMTAGTYVECIGESPLKDPKAFLIRGGVVALRFEDCFEILLQ
ncbi:MAG: ferrous iron transport protein A [Ruminococcaceae bacterium]|nr:ferrous iron transport protein A [Oscillospiraceae bacterium]